MRIIHTSDWHLGQNFYGKSRANEHQQFLTWLLTQVEQQQIDCIIVAGDIFDTGTPPSYAREMYFDFIVNMHKLSCQLVILAGNHDSVAMLGESKQLLNSLSVKVIPNASSNVIASPEDIAIELNTNDSSATEPNANEPANETEQVFYLKDEQGNHQAVICAVPFIRPRDILKSKAGESATNKTQALQQAIKDHYDGLYTQAKNLAELSNGHALPIIATGHLTTVGVTVSESVRDIYIGTLEAFPASAFPPADYIALGHIHRSQKVAKTEHIRYCGSPIPLSFDEAKQNKNILIVEFNANQLRQVTEVNIPCFQPIVMVKTQLDVLAESVRSEISKFTLNDDQKIWLDIEIQSSDYLQDLQKRIEQLTADLPVEILLVRRCKTARQTMDNQQKKITLNELSLEEVFEARLAQENWDNADDEARKERLTSLFKQAVDDVQNTDNEQATLHAQLDQHDKPAIAQSAAKIDDETNKSGAQK